MSAFSGYMHLFSGKQSITRNILRKIQVEDVIRNEAFKTETVYFTVPKTISVAMYPDADCATISVEYPVGKKRAKYAQTMISPTKDGSDYDWDYLDPPFEVIEELLRKTERRKKA